MEDLLSTGSLSQILENKKPANPVLQIIGYKPMTPDQMAFTSNPDDLRYRLMIGDGLITHQYCVITNQDIVSDIKNGRLEKWSIIRVTAYQTNDCGSEGEAKKRLIYILNLELVKQGSEVGRKLICQAPKNNISTTSPMQQQPINRLPNNSFSNQPMETQPQPYPMSAFNHTPEVNMIRSPRANRSQDQHIIGIGELTPYIGKWVVKGRVTSKSQIREYNNAKGGGKLYNFSLSDKTGEIKITAFNVDCERTFPQVEINKVYLLGRASVKAADKRYSNADFEITLNNDSLLEEVVDQNEVNDVPLAKFNFVSLGSLANALPNGPVDLIGAITDVGEPTTITSKTKNKELKKRDITIVDMSRHTMSVTIWGDQAFTFSGTKGDIFVTKAARVGSYGGRSASAGDCMFINPDIPEVRKMKGWYNNLLEENFTPLTNGAGSQSGGDQWMMLDQLLNLEQAKLALSSGQNSVYAKCKAWLMSVGRNPVYKCCPTEGCGKKLVDTQNGELKCEKCQQTFASYKFRYKTDVELSDNSSSTWVTLWDEKAEHILGRSPEDLERLMKTDNKDEYERVLNAPTFKPFIFTLRAKMDNYQGQERVKCHVVQLVDAEPSFYAKRLIDEIKKMSADPV